MEVALPSYSANELEPAIHRLVDDILEYIFLLNATPPFPQSEDPTTVGHATTLASSQVCTRWRSIALNCHTIWGLIIDYRRHSLKWIETLLDRSNPSSLDFGSRICGVFMGNGGEGVLELVFSHIDRLRIFCLHWQGSVSTWELVCSRFLQLPALNLEFVYVSFLEIAGHLTHPLFNNNAPNLQTLRLIRCSVDFTSPVLTPLTELYVHSVGQKNAVSVLDWLNILGGMPSLRWVTLVKAISRSPANDIFPVIHLGALDMLSVEGPFHECVTLVKHLMMPPRCGLRLRCDHVQLGFDQRQLWAIIEKKIDSWTKNANRQFFASRLFGSVVIKNVLHGSYNDDSGWATGWATEAKEVHNQRYQHLLDPTMTIKLRLSNSQEAVPLFLSLFALFERTFFDTTRLHLWIHYDDGDEVFLPLVDIFRGFVNLEKLYILHKSLVELLFPHLQQANSVLLPALKSLNFHGIAFGQRSTPIFRVTDFLQWRREQGFPVQKIAIEGCWIDRKYSDILTHIQDTVVEIADSNLNYSESDMEEDYTD